MGADTRIVLIRHGEARSGVNGIIGGPNGDTGLTERGRAQAESLRDRLAQTNELQPQVLLASVLPRAIETAEIVAAAFDRSLELQTDCDYCEHHPGECDGMAWDDYNARYRSNDFGPDTPFSPGGESTREFDARVRRALWAMLDEYEHRSVVLFTHGGFVSAATLAMFNAPGLHERTQRPARFLPHNTSITEFRRADGGEQWLLERCNDTAHLMP